MQTKKNNFKNYQDEKVAKRLIIIDEKIAEYKKRKVKFENITEMAGALAEHISKKEDSSCSNSTILRNAQYKSLIEDYFYSQPGVRKPGAASNLVAELTVSNIERENIRLKQYISTLEKELDGLKNTSCKNQNDYKNNYLSKSEVTEAGLKKALNLIIEHFSGLVTFNENGDLIDLTKKVNNVILKKDFFN